jgi:hypothetical protein
MQLLDLVGQPHVQRIAIRRGIERHGENPHLAARANDARGDLTAVGNQNFFEHKCQSFGK